MTIIFSTLYSQKVKEKTGYLYEYKPYIWKIPIFGRIRFVNDDREMINKLIDRNIDLNKELILIGEATLKKEERRRLKEMSGLSHIKPTK